VNRRALGALIAGHASVDLCQGGVAALVPFLVDRRGLSLTAASALLLVMSVFSSLVQPLYGVVADRRSGAWLMPAGVLVAAAGIGTVGVVHSYAAIAAAVAVAGIGVAMFHPEGARAAGAAGGDTRTAASLSFFSVGGNTGFALAPALLTPAVLLFGLEGSLVALVPAAVVAVVLVVVKPADRVGRVTHQASGEDDWGQFARVATVAALRTGVYFSLQAFAAVHIVRQFGTSEATGNAAVTAMLVAGAVGTLVGGRLADTPARQRLVLIGFLVVVAPAIGLFLIAPSPALAVVALVVVGFSTIGNFSVTVAMGQRFLPSRPGLASGVTLGLAMGVGGGIAAALGPLADSAGTTAAIAVAGSLALPAVWLARSVSQPPPAPRRPPAAPTAQSPARA
jgi:FSR family fosmidomycin resistance protein-like MFS transporter